MHTIIKLNEKGELSITVEGIEAPEQVAMQFKNVLDKFGINELENSNAN